MLDPSASTHYPVACILRKARHSREDFEMFFILRASLEHKFNQWSGQVAFPGGHIEPGETDEQAAWRECREEVGFNLDKPGAQLRYLDLPHSQNTSIVDSHLSLCQI